MDRRSPFPIVAAVLAVSFTVPIDGSAQTVLVQERTGPDGVRELLSRAEPPYPVPWRLRQELSIGTAYGDEAYMLNSPSMLALAPDGSIILLDRQPLRLRVFDPDGEALAAFGQPGRGPGDLLFSGSNIATLRPHGTDGIEYWSGWPSRIQTWDLRGALESIRTLPGDHPLVERGRPWRFGPFGEGVYAFYDHVGRGSEDPRGTDMLLIGGWEPGPARAVFQVPSFDWPGLGALGRAVGMAQAVSDHTPTTRPLVTRSGRVFYSGLTEDWVHEFDPDNGREILRFRLSLDAPEAIPRSEVDRIRREVDPMIADGMQWWREHFWFHYLVEGPAGQIWVQRTGNANEEGVWPTDVFGDDGRYLGRLELDFAPYRMLAEGDRLYVLKEGTEGEPLIVRYRLIGPG